MLYKGSKENTKEVKEVTKEGKENVGAQKMDSLPRCSVGTYWWR